MHILYLGTAAAEGVPALFCQCDTCRQAQARGGKDLRMRSSVLIDERLMVDVSPDLLCARHRFGLDLARVRDIVITHAHMDHFAREALSMFAPGFAHIQDRRTLRLFGTAHTRRVWEEYLTAAVMKEPDLGQYIEFYTVKPFDVFEAGGMTVTALPAVHSCPQSVIYAFEQDGKRFLYANDTGLFPQETWAWLEAQRDRPFDAVSLDSTMGLPDSKYTGHMTLKQNVYTRETMIQNGSATENTAFLCHHFSHNGRILHRELEALMGPQGFDIAYDGLTLTL